MFNTSRQNTDKRPAIPLLSHSIGNSSSFLRTRGSAVFRPSSTMDPASKKAILNFKLRVLRTAIVFLHRLQKRLEYVKTYGVSNFYLYPKLAVTSEKARLIKDDDSVNLSMNSTEILLRDYPTLRHIDRFLFFPHQLWYLFWNLLGCAVLVYLLIFVPLILALNIQTPFYEVADHFVDAYFLFDFLITFNLAVSTPDGSYETYRSKIARHYYNNGLLIDLALAIPVGWVLVPPGLITPGMASVVRLLKLPRLYNGVNRNRRLSLSAFMITFKIPPIWKYKIKSKQNLLRILAVLLQTYILIHLAACIWLGLCRFPFTRTRNWALVFGVSGQSGYSQYISSAYFVVNTLATLGYGDIFSTNHYERVFCILWMLFGVSFYSYMIGYVTEYFLANDDRVALMNERLKRLDYFCLDRGIDARLKEAIEQNIEYASNIIYYRWVEGEKNLFCGLPIEIKFEFYKNVHPELVASPFFDSKNYFFTVSVIDKMKPVKLRRDQFVWLKGEASNYIVFVVKGSLFLLMDNVFYRTDKSRENLIAKSSKRIESKMFDALKTFNLKGQQKDDSGRLARNKHTVQEYFWALDSPDLEISELPLIAFKRYGASAYIGEDDLMSEANHPYYLKASVDSEVMILSKSDFDATVKQSFPAIYKKVVEYSVRRNADLQERKIRLIKDISVHYKRNGFDLNQKRGLNLAHRTVSLFEKEKEKNRLLKYDEILNDTAESHPIQRLMELCGTGAVQDQPVGADRSVFLSGKSVGVSKLYFEWHSDLTRVEAGAADGCPTDPEHLRQVVR